MIKKILFVLLFMLSINSTNAMGLPGWWFPWWPGLPGWCSSHYDSSSCNMTSWCSRSYMTWSCQSWWSNCWNWVINSWETCDDFNTYSFDWCSSTCQTETRCWDGIKQTPNTAGVNEVCDDWNNIDWDTCNATCTAIISNTCDFSYNINALSCINNWVDFQHKKEIFRNGNDIYYQDLNDTKIFYKNSTTLNTGLQNAGTHDIKYSNGYIFYYVNDTFFKRNILDMSNSWIRYYTLSNRNWYWYLTDGRYVLFRAPNWAGWWSYYNKLDTDTWVETSNSVNFSEWWSYDFNWLYWWIFFARNHHNTWVSTWVVKMIDGETLSLPVIWYNSQDVLGEDENFIYFLHYDWYVYKLNKTWTLIYTKTNIINQGKIYLYWDKFITYQYSDTNAINSLIQIYNINWSLITEWYHSFKNPLDTLVWLKYKDNHLYLWVYISTNSVQYSNSFREIIKIDLLTKEMVYSSIGDMGIRLSPSYNEAYSISDNENVFYFYRSTFTRKYVKIAVNTWENTRSSWDSNGNYGHYILNRLTATEWNMQQVNNSAGSTSFSNSSQVKLNFLANYTYMQSWYEAKWLTTDVINNNVDWWHWITFSKTDVAGWMLDWYKLSAHYQFKSYVETDNTDSSVFWRTDLSNTSFQTDTTWAIWLPVFPIKNWSGTTIAYLEFPCWNLICKDQFCSEVKKLVTWFQPPVINPTVSSDPGNWKGWCWDWIKNTKDEECDINDWVEHNKWQSCNAQCKIETSPGVMPWCPTVSALAFKCEWNLLKLIFDVSIPTPPGGWTGIENIPAWWTWVINKEVSWTPSFPNPPTGVTDNDLYNNIIKFFPITDDVWLYKDFVCEITQTGTKLYNKILVIDNSLEDKDFLSKLKNKESFITTLNNNNDLANSVLEEKLKSSKLNQKSNLYDLWASWDISGIQFNLTKIPNSAIMRKLVDLAIDHSSTTMADYEQTVKNSCNWNTTITWSMLVPAWFINTNEKGETILNLFRYNNTK